MRDLNQVLHEKVMEECWHEWERSTNEYYFLTCKKCKSNDGFGRTDYLHDPVAYWRLLQKVGEEGMILLYAEWKKSPKGKCFTWMLLNQQRGCEAIADFFVPEWRKL